MQDSQSVDTDKLYFLATEIKLSLQMVIPKLIYEIFAEINYIITDKN